MPYRKTRRTFKKRRQKRRTLRKYRRKAKIPRPLARKDFFQTVFHLSDTQQTLWTMVSGSTGSVTQVSMVLYMNMFNGFQDMSRHFECYRPNLFVIKWVPVMTENSNREISDATNPPIQAAVPDCYYLKDRNDNGLYTGTPQQIIDLYRGNRRTVIRKATRPYKTLMKPSLLSPSYKSGEATGGPLDWCYNTVYNQWVQLNQGATALQVSYFCMKAAIDDGAQGQFVMRPEVKVYCSFMKRKPL